MALAAAGFGLTVGLLVMAQRCLTKSMSWKILQKSVSSADLVARGSSTLAGNLRKCRGLEMQRLFSKCEASAKTQYKCMELLGTQDANKKVRRLGRN